MIFSKFGMNGTSHKAWLVDVCLSMVHVELHIIDVYSL